MRKFINILIGFLLIAAAGVMIFFAGAIYDTGDKLIVRPYFFQPDSFSNQRIGQPMTAHQLGDDTIRDMLLQRFVTEYFYVIPDESNAMARTGGKLRNPFARMASDDIFNQWLENTAPIIQEMAAAGKLRLVQFYNDTANHGISYDEKTEYWQIAFDLHTWDTPNNLGAIPAVTQHVMFVRFTITDILPMTIQKMGIHKYLEDGGDPASLYLITVKDVIVK